MKEFPGVRFHNFEKIIILIEYNTVYAQRKMDELDNPIKFGELEVFVLI